jgi:nitroreductase
MEATRESWQESPKWEPISGENTFKTAPVYILLCGDTRTQEGLPMSLRYESARMKVSFTSSLSNAFLYMHIAASALGLASQWVSSVAHPYAECMIKNLLGIPKEVMNLRHACRGVPGL